MIMKTHSVRRLHEFYFRNCECDFQCHSLNALPFYIQENFYGITFIIKNLYFKITQINIHKCVQNHWKKYKELLTAENFRKLGKMTVQSKIHFHCISFCFFFNLVPCLYHVYYVFENKYNLTNYNDVKHKKHYFFPI